MKILIGDEWRAGYLDAWRAPNERRIAVRQWVVVAELNELFVPQRFDVRRLIDYGREVGPVEVARKVMSRLSESHRNEKYAACGRGVDVDSGELVAFFAPVVSRCMERVTVPRALSWSTSEVPDGIAFVERPDSAFDRWAGWTRDSGRPLEQLDELEQRVFDALTAQAQTTYRVESSEVEEQRGEAVEGERQKASVFGYGHYVRTLMLTSLPPEIEVVTVHELDPVLAPDSFPAVDTCPHLRQSERPDVVFVAGFHHSHAPLATEALRRGAWVVSEKPLATTASQLDDLLSEWRTPSRYFASFQRRFMAPNDWVVRDLGASESDPMSYHALVHEVSLPAGHWYHWPASGSRMLSNGCHWIDHFLWLNDFSAVVERRAHRGPNGEIISELTLENGAYFTMTLTDRGSDRLGVREHTELRVRDRTAVLSDMSSYVCEGPRGVLRRESFHKLAAHRTMYETFARRILAGEPGDTKESVERTTRTVLELEAMLQGDVQG